MDYKELIERLRDLGDYAQIVYNDFEIEDCMLAAATAIETLLEEREAAIHDLTELGQSSPDSCHLCAHLPCTEKYGHCIGWQWRGPTPPDQEEST